MKGPSGACMKMSSDPISSCHRPLAPVAHLILPPTFAPVAPPSHPATNPLLLSPPLRSMTPSTTCSLRRRITRPSSTASNRTTTLIRSASPSSWRSMSCSSFDARQRCCTRRTCGMSCDVEGELRGRASTPACPASHLCPHHTCTHASHLLSAQVAQSGGPCQD